MSRYIKEIEVSELRKLLDNTISELRKELGEVLRRVEYARAQSEFEKRLIELLGSKLSEESTKETKINNLILYVEPRPETLIRLFEEMAEKIQHKINELSNIRKFVIELEKNVPGAIVTVIFEDDLPKVMIFK